MITVFFNGCLILPAYASEQLSPTETLKGPVDEVIAILKDPAYHGPDKKGGPER